MLYERTNRWTGESLFGTFAELADFDVRLWTRAKELEVTTVLGVKVHTLDRTTKPLAVLETGLGVLFNFYFGFELIRHEFWELADFTGYHV